MASYDETCSRLANLPLMNEGEDKLYINSLWDALGLILILFLLWAISR